jgi:hypothetical protein
VKHFTTTLSLYTIHSDCNHVTTDLRPLLFPHSTSSFQPVTEGVNFYFCFCFHRLILACLTLILTDVPDFFFISKWFHFLLVRVFFFSFSRHLFVERGVVSSWCVRWAAQHSTYPFQTKSLKIMKFTEQLQLKKFSFYFFKSCIKVVIIVSTTESHLLERDKGMSLRLTG